MNKLDLYEKLGAVKFKEIVLRVEKLKYKLLKPFSNKIIAYSDKILNKRLNKMLKKEKDENKRKILIHYFNKEKLRTRIEFNNEENRNYHFNTLNPKETLSYLNINKQIHVQGIKSNLLYIIILGTAIIILKGTIIPLSIAIGFNILSMFINFQCINLQNYNIARIEEKLEKLTRVRERSLKQKIKLYKNISQALAPLLEKEKGVPKKDDIINCLQTKEEVEELQELIQTTIRKKERKLKL